MIWTAVLTGGIGSGKSLVASEFARLGIKIVDQDDVSREVVEPGTPALEAIKAHFGDEILAADGSLNRRALRERIFADPDERMWLNRLLHPTIGEQTNRHLRSASSKYAIVVNPLLRHRQTQYDRFIVVDVPVELQIRRTMQRDNIGEELVKSMIATQTPRDVRLAIADDVIKNDGTACAVTEQVERLHRRYLVMSYA